MSGTFTQYTTESRLLALGLTVFAGLAMGIGSCLAFRARRERDKERVT